MNVDNAVTTHQIFDGKLPIQADPALANRRVKMDIIQSVKKKKSPFGSDIAGVMNRFTSENETLSESERYIHKVVGEPGCEMVVTMLLVLAARIHTVDASLHDNTYKCVYGEWKEWEVVVWDKKLNMRITIARIYCTREKHETFREMWGALWDIIEKVTGNRVRFKFMDGEGLRAIIVDGCKAQVEGCGDDLRNRAFKLAKHELSILSSQEIVQHIVKTCVVHLDRKFDDIAKVVPPKIMIKVRNFCFLESESEVKDFVEWCRKSHYKIIRDWMEDKIPYNWFIPSVNKFMSKIPLEDWHLTPENTNLNESAHPFTNLQTGTGLSLLDAIDSARKVDHDMLLRIQECERNFILVNPHNTPAQRDAANLRRRERTGKTPTARASIKKEIAALNTKIKALNEEKSLIPPAQRSTETKQNVTRINCEISDILNQKKKIQRENGIQRSPQKLARGKAVQDMEDMAEELTSNADLDAIPVPTAL